MLASGVKFIIMKQLLEYRITQNMNMALLAYSFWNMWSPDCNILSEYWKIVPLCSRKVTLLKILRNTPPQSSQNWDPYCYLFTIANISIHILMANENTLVFFPLKQRLANYDIYLWGEKTLPGNPLFFSLCHRFSLNSERFWTPLTFSYSFFSVPKAFNILHMV